ncbi:MAG: hypothetical protein ACRDSR_17805 [Pseudonocardiaceae bacterium]
MANGKDGPLAKLAIIISAFTFVITGIGVYLSYSQVKDLREQFDWSGAVLSVETSVQLKYNDGRREPVTLSEQQHPALTDRDFDTSDAIYLVYKVQNAGRLDTTLTGAELRIGRDIIIKADDAHVRSLCAAREAVRWIAGRHSRLFPLSWSLDGFTTSTSR